MITWIILTTVLLLVRWNNYIIVTVTQWPGRGVILPIGHTGMVTCLLGEFRLRLRKWKIERFHDILNLIKLQWTEHTQNITLNPNTRYLITQLTSERSLLRPLAMIKKWRAEVYSNIPSVHVSRSSSYRKIKIYSFCWTTTQQVNILWSAIVLTQNLTRS